MKTKITALALIATTALTLAPKPAQASDKGLALVGGLIGGLIIGSALNDSRHDDYPRRTTTVIVNDRRNDDCDDRGDAGYWNEVSVRVWVPGYWTEERRHHGYSYRHYVEGYYTYRTDRVWVAYERYDRSDRHNHHGYRGYGRGR